MQVCVLDVKEPAALQGTAQEFGEVLEGCLQHSREVSPRVARGVQCEEALEEHSTVQVVRVAGHAATFVGALQDACKTCMVG